MQKVCKFLKSAGTYYLATVEGDQPRVRPFGTAHIFEGKLYIQTGKSKPVSSQIAVNHKCEICAFKDGVWLRVAAELVEDDRVEAKKSMLDDYTSLRAMYDENDSNTQVLYLILNSDPEVYLKTVAEYKRLARNYLEWLQDVLLAATPFRLDSCAWKID